MPVCPSPSSHTHEFGGARFTTLAAPSTGSTEASLWRVEIPAGAPAAPHQLTREELIAVVSGTARAEIDGRAEQVGPGGVVIVPPGVPFALSAVGPEPLVAFACLPVGGQARMVGREPFTPPWAK